MSAGGDRGFRWLSNCPHRSDKAVLFSGNLDVACRVDQVDLEWDIGALA